MSLGSPTTTQSGGSGGSSTITGPLGSKPSAQSVSVVIASDQASFPITANQGSANATPWNENIAQVGGVNVSLGQNTMVNSIPVVIASNQLPVEVELFDSNENGITSTSGALDINIKSGNPTSITANIGTTNGLALDATLTGGNQQTKITDGTNIANVLKSDGTVAGQNAQLIAPAVQTITFTTSSSGAQTILANTDVSHYAWMEIVYTSVGSGLALTGQFSTANGGTYVNSSSFSTQAGTPGGLGVAVNTIYTGPVKGNFFQVAVSALTSGTFAGTLTLRTAAPPNTSTLLAAQSGTWTVQPGNTPNTSPWLVDIHATGAALADATANPTTSLVGALSEVFNGTTWDRVRSMGGISAGSSTGLLATGVAGGLMPNGTALNTYEATISTATTTTVTSSTAYISSIVITVDVGGAGSTLTIQDRQGTPQILVNGLATATTATGPTIYNFQTPIKMTSGISIVTTSVTPATDAVWISYYQ